MNKLALATLLDQNPSERHQLVTYTKSDKGIIADFELASVVNWRLLIIFIAIDTRRR